MTYMTDLCEWNPVLHQAAISPRRETDCKNESMWRVGDGHATQVCATCAHLPEFDRFTHWHLIKRGEE